MAFIEFQSIGAVAAGLQPLGTVSSCAYEQQQISCLLIACSTLPAPVKDPVSNNTGVAASHSIILWS